MYTRKVTIPSLIVSLSIALAACSPNALSVVTTNKSNANQAVQQATQAPQADTPAQTSQQPASNGALATSLSAYETALEGIYTKVNPSVVNIQVLEKSTASANPFGDQSTPGFQFFFGNPQSPNSNNDSGQVSSALGSGFVWDTEGHIVTNNHVVGKATKIQVKFADGTIADAKLVGTDVNSDLAVIQVENYKGTLTPVTVADSTSIKVGQAAIAIGNPYGLENTMTFGIVSAIGRSLPTDMTSVDGATFTIPDIIQTDAPINPGNSGGVLVNDNGDLIGVTSAIESSSGSNAGIGFAIPSATVQKVIPALIKDGKYEHAYLGLTGTTLTPDLAKSMNVDSNLRGILVISVSDGGPSDMAGVKGSSKQVTINGQPAQVGGDIVTKIDGQALTSMDDLISYLANNTTVGQKVTLTVLRDGKEQSVEATLAARPTTTDNLTTVKNQNPQDASGQGWLGLSVTQMSKDIANEMGLPADQQGVLIEAVEAGSPADKADLRGSYKPVLINNKRVMVGGDVITAVDGASITSPDELKTALTSHQSGEQVTLTILRDGKQMEISATLGEKPVSQQ